MPPKILIVGGVAGGVTAATRLRRLQEGAEIIVFERGQFVSFANCGLPYYIGDEIKNEKDLLVQTPEQLRSRFNIDVRTNCEVISISREQKTIQVKDNSGKVYSEQYDKLILSPGAEPVVPNIPGIDNPLIQTLRTIPDATKIKRILEGKDKKRVVVIGGGLIGLEVSENIRKFGHEITIIDAANHLLQSVDIDIAALVHKNLQDNGIRIILKARVIGFQKGSNEKEIVVEINNGEKIVANLVVMSIGTSPESKLAQESNLSISLKNKTILVNRQMQTSDKDIYAVGDAVLIEDLNLYQPLAGPANKQARIVADVLSGIQREFQSTLCTSIVRLFEMTFAQTGISETQAKEIGIPIEVVYITESQHAGYFPNSKILDLKVIFNRENQVVIGAEIAGYDGVDKRIDVLSTAVQAKITANDLATLQLAYSPPFSSAKDPVNLSGLVMQNVSEKLVQQFHWNDIASLRSDKKNILLDVRTASEFNRGNIEGAINVPLDEIRQKIGDLEKYKGNILCIYCQIGRRGYFACRILAQHGFICKNLAGGYRLWDIVNKFSNIN